LGINVSNVSLGSGLLRNRLLIVSIILISALPFGAAWYLSQHTELVHDRQKSNYGHFVSPPLPLDYAELLQNPVSAVDSLSEVKGRWVLVQLVTASGCDSACLETSHKTAQLRLMLNKEISRVRRLLLVSGAVDEAALKTLAEQDPTLVITRIPDALLQKLNAAAGVTLADGTLLLLDPFANLMMRYDVGFDPYGVLRDLQKLLKASQIG
jgi:hypothetical protein